jgi:hypothetical protein
MFRLANRYDSKRCHLRSKITRLFVYKWFGASPAARLDLGLVSADGTPREAFFVFRRFARSPLTRLLGLESVLR